MRAQFMETHENDNAKTIARLLEFATRLQQTCAMSQPGFIRPHSNGVYLAVKLQPRASKNEIGEPLGDELKIKVTAPPVDAAANQALIDLLAEKLNCSRGKIQIVRGQTSRHKTISIEGKTVEEVLKCLRRSE